MNRLYEFSWFIGLQIILALAYIYKESVYIAAFYEQQKLEKKRDELVSHHKTLTQQMHMLKNRSTIIHAVQQNGLKPLKLATLRHVHVDQRS